MEKCWKQYWKYMMIFGFGYLLICFCLGFQDELWIGALGFILWTGLLVFMARACYYVFIIPNLNKHPKVKSSEVK